MDLRTLVIPAPRRGLVDGIDPASPLFPDDAASEILNLRPFRATWRPRLGLYHWKTLPASTPWFLATHHHSSQRVRLTACGSPGAVQLYDLIEGVDSSFQAVSGGGSLAGGFIQSVQIGSYTYLSDLSGALRRYTTTGSSGGGTLAAVTQPAAPTVAPNALATWAGFLEVFGAHGAADPYGFTQSDGSNFYIDAAGADNPLPEPYDEASVVLTMKGGSSDDDRITKNSATPIELNSFWLALYARQSDGAGHVALQYGSSRAAEAGKLIKPERSNEWEPHFFPLNYTSLKYLRFKCVKGPSSDQTLRLSPIVLPGRLDGKYKWCYTYYNSETGAESEPSPEYGATSAAPSQGTTLNLSEQGKSGDDQTTEAMKKCALLHGTPGANVNTANWKIRWYRNGGAPEFTVDPDGTPVWVLVGEVTDLETSFNSSPSANATSFTPLSTTGMSVGDWLVLEPGVTDREEFVKISSIAAGVVYCTSTPLVYAHTSSTSNKIRPAFLDNTPESGLALATRIDRERDDPPSGIKWLAKAPDGRLWAAYGTNDIAVSNQPTNARQQDHEVFPVGVDPITRRHPLQGWRFKIAADDPGDSIQWMGFYQGAPTILTSRSIYQANALNQQQWAATAVQMRWREGCLNGRTVAEVNGSLYWVAPGPQVVRWDGSGPPQPVSFERISETLKAAPSAYWSLWHAQAHVKEEGPYYCLWIVPSGGTTPTDGFQFNVVSEAWEPVGYYVANGGLAKQSMDVGHVLRGTGDTEQYYLASQGTTKVYEADRAGQLTDDTLSIIVRYRSKRFPLAGAVGKIEWINLRGAAAADSMVNFQVRTGGSDYGDVNLEYGSFDITGSGDFEIRKRGRQTQKGRWAQLYFELGSVARFAPREIDFRFRVLRDGRVKD